MPPIEYLKSYIETTYENCENNICTSLKSLCTLDDNDYKFLGNYGVPNGLTLNKYNCNTISTKNSGVINDEIFDNLVTNVSKNSKNMTRKNSKIPNNHTKKK